MKTMNGKTYLTIGEVSKLIKRTPQTIKSWYTWVAEKGATSISLPLPPRYNNLDAKKTNYFLSEDVQHLIDFRDAITYGVMAEFNIKRWGKRGEGSIRKSEMLWTPGETNTGKARFCNTTA